jgi:hypothetical protein
MPAEQLSSPLPPVALLCDSKQDVICLKSPQSGVAAASSVSSPPCPPQQLRREEEQDEEVVATSPEETTPRSQNGQEATDCMAAAGRTKPLRLPEIKPVLDDDEKLQLISGISPRGSKLCGEIDHRFGVSGLARSNVLRQRTNPTKASFEDFLDSATIGKPRASGNRLRNATAPRPTARQPIDDETAVPAEVFERMLRLGAEARSRATHVIAFAHPHGKPYLRRHDAPERPAPGLETVSLRSRPASACANEVSSGDLSGLAHSHANDLAGLTSLAVTA